MSAIVMLSILYGIILFIEEEKWEEHGRQWMDLMNSGN